MPFAAGIKFRKESFSDFYNPGDLAIQRDDFCWVRDKAFDIDRIGFVSSVEGRAPVQLAHLPSIVRMAKDSEVEAWYDLKVREREMTIVARNAAAGYRMNIKITELVLLEDKRQVMIQFTSENRVDFRELVRDLAGKFRARIEMWQINSRREASTRKGIGICGNELCCGCWMKDFPSITMKYAREQDIIQPPSKLSGPCNKLRCCLRHEHEAYLQLADGAPTVGCKGCSSAGSCGVVVDRNLLKGELVMRGEDGIRHTMDFDDFSADGTSRKALRAEPKPEPVGSKAVITEKPKRPVASARPAAKAATQEKKAGDQPAESAKSGEQTRPRRRRRRRRRQS